MSAPALRDGAARPASPLASDLRLVLADPAAMVGLSVIVLFAVLAIFAPWLAPHDPNQVDFFRRLQPPAWMKGGEWAYPLGCDGLGRDILSRIIFGARISMFIGLLVVACAATIGVLAGLAAGYLRGWVDVVISRIVDILLGFPYMIFAIALMAVMGAGFANIIVALVLMEWVLPCRVVRAEALAVSQREYVEAAKALGASDRHVMLREILPNILSPIIVVGTVRIANIIIVEASLSFLGLGIQPPTASWGSMIADGRQFLLNAWWVSTFPGLAIFALVLAINVASQSLRDIFDPRFQK